MLHVPRIKHPLSKSVFTSEQRVKMLYTDEKS